MTFREKLADWISGGALSQAKYWRADAHYYRGLWLHELGRGNDGMKAAACKMSVLQERLHRIAAMETPGANATVRRMAKAAREARG